MCNTCSDGNDGGHGRCNGNAQMATQIKLIMVTRQVEHFNSKKNDILKPVDS
jgi:hypothetical protein